MVEQDSQERLGMASYGYSGANSGANFSVHQKADVPRGTPIAKMGTHIPNFRCPVGGQMVTRS